MKREYEPTEIEIIKFDNGDIICTSGENDFQPGEDETDIIF